MKTVLMLVVSALFALPGIASTAAGNCAQARDPVRCEAYQAALKACAKKRGAEKQTCLRISVPPADCSMSDNPQGCKSAEKARQSCNSLKGKPEERCRRHQQPRQAKNTRRPL